MMPQRKVPSLIDLCVTKAIDNVRYIGNVGETDAHLLERILLHCTVDQLMHIEKSTEGRDLSPITNKLWKKFFERQFGTECTNEIVQRMKQKQEMMRQKKVSITWMQVYEAKLKHVDEAQNKSLDRIRQLYKKEDARKQSRQVRLVTKVPPSSNKRSFYGSGPGYNVSNLKGNLMKKARVELLKSQEVKNLAAMKKNAVQRTNGVSPMMKQGSFSVKGSASTSKSTNLTERRYY